MREEEHKDREGSVKYKRPPKARKVSLIFQALPALPTCGSRPTECRGRWETVPAHSSAKTWNVLVIAICETKPQKGMFDTPHIRVYDIFVVDCDPSTLNNTFEGPHNSIASLHMEILSLSSRLAHIRKSMEE
jgi:hypothetical protein